MSPYTCDNESVGADTHEYEGCPLRFCLLRHTSHSGNIVLTRPSALWLFAYATACQWTPAFSSPPDFSPVSGVVPSTLFRLIKSYKTFILLLNLAANSLKRVRKRCCWPLILCMFTS